MRDVPESPEERQRKRRARRWKRRARILGPFLGIPILLVTLSLSVDLVEYHPQEKKDRLSDQPIRLGTPRAETPSSGRSPRPGLIEDMPAPGAIPFERDTLSGISIGSEIPDPLIPSPETVPDRAFETPATLYPEPVR